VTSKPRSLARSSRGLTLVELVAASAVMAILAAITLPVAATMVKRQKELELRRNLRTIREAINRFHDDVERYPGMRQKLNAVNEDGYPEELEHLYEGFDIGDAKGTKLKYLRRLPRDPITGKAEWGTRSSRDRPGSAFSDGINVFDVYSKSDKTALDGTPYATW
jgi:general secretion pathway protein G